MKHSVRSDFLAFGRPNFTSEEIEAVTRVMQSGWIGMGNETITFERELAEFLETRNLVTVNSCTSALFLSLLVLGVGKGDEVICPSLTWCSTANAALYIGATPVLCDVDPDTLCVTPETVLACLTPRTKAVIVVHMGGLAVDVDSLRCALPKDVEIVEDAAHALGARYPNGTPVGASGNFVCFSFYANKNLSTAEGGAVALSDDDKADRLRSLRQHSLVSDAWKRYIDPKKSLITGIDTLGYKMNYTDLQAAIGRVQLRRQQEFHRIRLDIALNYRDRLAQADVHLALQRHIFEEHHARHLLVIRLPHEHLNLSRDEILLALRERNIGASVHYTPLHHMPLYAPFATSVTETDRLAHHIITLPISASMVNEDVDYVSDHLLELLSA